MKCIMIWLVYFYYDLYDKFVYCKEVINFVVHLFYHLFGMPSAVHTFNQTFRKIETEDTSVINLNWDGNFLGSLAITMLTYPKNLEDSLTIIGEKGTVKIKNISKAEIEIWDFQEKQNYDQTITQTVLNDKDGHESVYEETCKIISNNKLSYVIAEEALNSLELVLAAKNSHLEKKIITI